MQILREALNNRKNGLWKEPTVGLAVSAGME